MSIMHDQCRVPGSATPSLELSDDLDVAGKRVLVRVDINSPIDPDTKRIVDDARIDKSVPTIRDLAERSARVVILAHQGDALDYHNLIPTEEHAGKLAAKLGRPVQWVDDVAGPEARRRIAALVDGEVLLLDNVRIYGEELTTFERDVELTPEQMADTYLVRNLAPLFDLYVNDAFATAHRAAPSMIAFQRLLPSAGTTSASMWTLRSNASATRRPTVDFPPPGGPVSNTIGIVGPAAIVRSQPVLRGPAEDAAQGLAGSCRRSPSGRLGAGDRDATPSTNSMSLRTTVRVGRRPRPGATGRSRRAGTRAST